MIYLRDINPTAFYRPSLPTILSSSTSEGRRTLNIPAKTNGALGTSDFNFASSISLDLDISSNWDSAYTSYATAANRAGADIYVYATASRIILSPNSTVPTGYNTTNSRKIGGFHCLCLSVGTISGHTLTGFLTGDILPASIWDLNFRPVCGQEGMVYSAAADVWVDIYLQSGTGVNTASVNGATITDTQTWMDHVDDLGSVGKRLLWDGEFQTIAEGSNQRTNIYGTADPVTTGGHVDTSSQRMVSNIGCEDCCGVMYQWLQDQQYKLTGTPDTGDPAMGWYTLPGSKGSSYRQGSDGDIKLLAGGYWNDGSNCGSRCRRGSVRWSANSLFAARGCARTIGG